MNRNRLHILSTGKARRNEKIVCFTNNVMSVGTRNLRTLSGINYPRQTRAPAPFLHLEIAPGRTAVNYRRNCAPTSPTLAPDHRRLSQATSAILKNRFRDSVSNGRPYPVRGTSGCKTARSRLPSVQRQQTFRHKPNMQNLFPGKDAKNSTRCSQATRTV